MSQRNGCSTLRVTRTRSASRPLFAENSKLASPAVSALTGNRTSTCPFLGKITRRCMGPRGVNPRAARLTSTSEPLAPLEVTMTPACKVSPTRRLRGRAGRAIKGRLVVIEPSPKPKRSSLPAATAINRNEVRLSGSLK